MPARLACLFCFVSTLFVAAPALQAQSQEIPNAPAPAAKSTAPNFTLPAATPHTILQSSGPPPPAPVKDTYCSAPADSGWRTEAKLSPAQHDEVKDFSSAVNFRIFTEWKRGMPRAVRDPWLKGASVLLRMTIRHNGALADTTIMMSSGRSAYDNHVLQAVHHAEPYPLPDDIQGPVIACIYFRYNEKLKE